MCGRCQYRGLTAKCFYHPAPLTKPRGTGSPRPRASSKAVTPLVNSGHQAVYNSVANNDEVVQYALRASNESDIRRSQFQDGAVNLRRQLGEILEVFDPFRSLEEVVQLVSEYTTTAQVALVPAPLMRYAISTLSETSRKYSLQQENDTTGAHQEFAAVVLQNTTSAVLVHADLDYKTYVDMFTGDSLRLEMLGIIYAVAARSRVYRLPYRREQKDSLLYRLFKAAQTCLNLARELASTVNDVTIWLSFEMTRLYTNAQGDAHPNVWRAMGDTISDTYIMELHREAKITANTPFWLAQCRRKNWAIIYHWDKVIATYFQRPPRIAKRYSDAELPLDLTDEELLGSSATLAQACANLTSEGWNPQGAYCSTTWYRMRFMASEILEDQWEFKDRKLDSESTSKLEQLADRCQTLRASLPACLHYHDGLLDSGMSPQAWMMLAIIHLLFLHNEVQVHSLLMRANSVYTGTTLKLAYQMVVIINNFGQVRDRNVFLQDDNAYVLLCYGLPAVSILIPALSGSWGLPEDISRSKLIRDLSVFISYLESICKEGDANYTICTQAARIFSRALDEILDPNSASTIPSTPVFRTNGFSGPAFAASRSTPAVADNPVPDLGFPMVDGLDGFDLDSWMQSVDWNSIGGEYTF